MSHPALAVVMAVPIVLATQAVQLVAPPAPPLPPITGPPAPFRPQPTLVSWAAGPVTCEGKDVGPELIPEPLSSLDTPFPGRPPDQSARFDFSVDATGRTVDVAPASDRYVPGGADLAPALTAARFPAGRAMRNCSVAFERRAKAIEMAPLRDLIAYTVFPSSRPSEAVWNRIRPAGSTCFKNLPAPLTRVFPDFDKIPQAPGTLGWTLVGYDIDSRGRTAKVRTAASTGNAALNRATTAAMRRSTFASGARTGCLYPYWRRGEPLPAPEAPPTGGYKPAGSTCPDGGEWLRRPVLSYPEPFRRRGVEGWAIVAYDVAPWGELGNMRVLAAQPAKAFGGAALGVMRSAARPPSASGYTGCVDRVRFVDARSVRREPGGEGPVEPQG